MEKNLVLVRIDDRLIHGQVAVGWVKATTPNLLLVANDTVAADPLQRSLMELAAPPDVEVRVATVPEAVELCHGPETKEQRILLLFSTPQDVLRAVEGGLALRQLNVGGMRYLPGKRQILKAVSIDDQDAACFRELVTRGIHVTVQMVPTDEPVDIAKVLTYK
jgi:mannose/fructose/sorbose-specific phosphotransferase system IIB component